MTKVFEASGRYRRNITAHKDRSRCYECDTEQECLIFDASEEEYSSICFCRICINSFFDGHISKKTWKDFVDRC